jgi:TRAP-type C4-dicarboxylate transport system permease small subunit
MLSFMRNLSSGINQTVRMLLAVFITVMLAALLLQIAARYLMKIPFPWVEELARYLMIWTGFLGSSLAIRRGSHLGFSMLAERLPRPLERLVSCGVALSIMVFLGFLIKYGWFITSFVRNQSSPTLPITMFWVYLAVPVGSAVMLLQTFCVLVEKLTASSNR